MPLDPTTRFEAAREAFRRRAGHPPSYAGIPGGAEAANQITSDNPLASMAMRRMEATGRQPTPGGARVAPRSAAAETDPFESMAIAGIKQLGQSAPGETEIFLKALIQRLRSLGSQPQTQQYG